MCVFAQAWKLLTGRPSGAAVQISSFSVVEAGCSFESSNQVAKLVEAVNRYHQWKASKQWRVRQPDLDHEKDRHERNDGSPKVRGSWWWICP